MPRRLEPATYLQLYNDIQNEQDYRTLDKFYEYVCALDRDKRISCRQRFYLKQAIRRRQHQCQG